MPITIGLNFKHLIFSEIHESSWIRFAFITNCLLMGYAHPTG